MWPREARLTPDDVEVAMTAASAEMLRQRRHHERRDVLPSRADRRRGRPRPAPAPIIATPLLPLPGLPPFDEQLQARRRAGRRRARRRHRRVRHRAARRLHRAAAGAAATPRPPAREHGLLLHLHVAETATEGADLLAAHGLSVPALLAAHDVLGGRVLAAHCVHMDDGDLELWREYDVAVAHCPASNAKLASGIAPLRAMLDRGIRVGMGTDGPASNDGLDLFADLRLAASLARLVGRVGDRADRGRGVLARHRRRRRRHRPAGPRAARRRAGARTSCTSTPGTWCSSRWAIPGDVLAHLVWSGARPARARRLGRAGGRWCADGASTTVDVDALRADVAARAARLAAG